MYAVFQCGTQGRDVNAPCIAEGEHVDDASCHDMKHSSCRVKKGIEGQTLPLMAAIGFARCHNGDVCQGSPSSEFVRFVQRGAV